MLRTMLYLLLISGSAASAQSARQQLQAFSGKLQTAEVVFQQTVTGPNGEKVQSAQGRMQLKSPNLFRWEYTKPVRQLIVADGRRIWVYDPDLQQVTVKSQDALNQDNPLSALTKPELIDRYYMVTELPVKQGVSWLQLKPKNPQNSPFDKAWLGFGANGLVSMRLFDSLGQVSEFTFGTWRKNKPIASSRFMFSPPKGVDVVE
ncbi:MAG: outer membrane lipoprotein chaperone LolA [Arenimonas sp.]|nr:outer membrane lipoprotein chaperone LolA [Arenimonas sp.]